MSSFSSKKKKYKKKSLWAKNILTRRIEILFHNIGGNIREILLKKLEDKLYNKCSKEGFIQDKSINILSYSSGIVEANKVMFDVMFECNICHPVEGQLIKCRVQNITRAGIKATYAKEQNSPILVFIARDHHYNNEYFNKIKENDNITVSVIGIRFELNDECISVLSELRPAKIMKTKTKVTVLEN
jgi:DNA-directed RNA polymerase subunit E'/Rpb7